MWSKGKRFRYPEEETQTYSNYADYIRKQFLISNNLLSRAGDVRMEASLALGSPKKKKGKRSGRRVSPASSYDDGEKDLHKTPGHDRHGRSEHNNPAGGAHSPTTAPIDRSESYSPRASPSAAALKMFAIAVGRSKSASNIRVAPSPTGGHLGGVPPESPMLALAPPGPATYHQQPSLVKPSFNRMLSDPRKHLPPEMQDIHGPRIEYQPSDNRNQSTFAGSPAGGMFLKSKRSKSAPVVGRVNSFNGPRPPSPSKGFAPAPKPIWSVSDHNPALLHQRYPPLSDRIMKRWTSTARLSYTQQAPSPKASSTGKNPARSMSPSRSSVWKSRQRPGRASKASKPRGHY